MKNWNQCTKKKLKKGNLKKSIEEESLELHHHKPGNLPEDRSNQPKSSRNLSRRNPNFGPEAQKANKNWRIWMIWKVSFIVWLMMLLKDMSKRWKMSSIVTRRCRPKSSGPRHQPVIRASRRLRKVHWSSKLILQRLLLLNRWNRSHKERRRWRSWMFRLWRSLGLVASRRSSSSLWIQRPSMNRPKI